MAIIGTKAGKRGRAGLGGLARVSDRNGILKASAWPRHKPRRKTKEFHDSVAIFDAWAAAYALISPEIKRQVREAAEGTQWLARDIHTVIMAGTMWSLTLPDGRKIFPMSAQINVSEALDALGNLPGGILVRQGEMWVFLPPGQPGQVLTIDVTGLPVWADSA